MKKTILIKNNNITYELFAYSVELIVLQTNSNNVSNLSVLNSGNGKFDFEPVSKEFGKSNFENLLKEFDLSKFFLFGDGNLNLFAIKKEFVLSFVTVKNYNMEQFFILDKNNNKYLLGNNLSESQKNSIRKEFEVDFSKN
jgi:hypothetical protein